MKNKVQNVLIFMIFILATFFNTLTVNAENYLLYEKSKTETITKGVTYTETIQVTSGGLRDIHVVKIPTNDPNIKINNTASKSDHNLKETVSSLINTQEGIAGVNADFFNMKGSHSHSQGMEVSKGNLISTDHINNLNKNEYATFLLNKDGSVVMDYIKTDMKFTIAGKGIINIYYYNKIPEMTYPVYVDGKAMSDTSPVDALHKNIYKVVVENDVITKVSEKGETVKVPSNGYVIMFNEEGAEYFLTIVKPGDSVKMDIQSSVDYSKIYTAVGGGAKLLSKGEIVYDSGVVIGGRNPRSAVGLTKDGSYLILLAVDGRGTSVGVSHTELAQVMLRYGGHEAIHLDGGGSTTMVVKTPIDSKANVVNNPSDGKERKVKNAIGVFNESEKGAIHSIKLEFRTDNIFTGAGTPYKVYAFDEYLNNIDFNPEKLSLVASDGGTFKNNKFYPVNTGNIIIKANYENITNEMNIKANKLMALDANINYIQTVVGEENPVSFSGVNGDGAKAYIYDGLNYEVLPKDLGVIENGIFKASKDGIGYIKISAQNLEHYIDVSVGLKDVAATSFETETAEYTSYPTNIAGWAGSVSENPAQGAKAIKLSYAFNSSNNTQAAYVLFKDKIQLPQQPKRIKLSVFGDNSNNWLRMKLVDGNGKEILLDLTKEIDWTGYKELSVSLPTSITYPIYLERIYVASTSNKDETKYSLYFDKLIVETSLGGKAEHPANIDLEDSLRKNLKNNPVENSFDITAIGNIVLDSKTKPDNYVGVQTTILNSFVFGSRTGLFVSSTDYAGAISIPVLKYSKHYGFYSVGNVGVINFDNSQGNFYSSNQEQWLNFQKDIKAKGKKHIIIETTLNPLATSATKELSILHEAFVELKNEGYNIFVVSSDGNSNSVNLKDGIRYINLAKLYKSDKTVNNDFRVLRFRIADDKIIYDLEKVF